MSLPQQQEYINQISLLHKKIMHLEETLKIEEEENQLQNKIEFHHANSVKEADIIVRKKAEHNTQQRQLLEEEGARRCIVKKMVNSTSSSLAPITDVLVHFEGTSFWVTHSLTY